MISRLLKKQIDAQLSHYPAVALSGARQTGKTTLAKAFEGRYFDLENPQDRLRLEVTWEELMGTQELVILDEIQARPELFPRLRAAIDADRKRCGRFLMLGSVAPALMQRAGQALTGRLALCQLTGFLAQERPAEEWDSLWVRGGYPDGGILDASRFPDWQQNYLALMAQRDLPSWGLPAQPVLIERLFRMLAALHGQHAERFPTRQKPGVELSHRQCVCRLPIASIPDPAAASLYCESAQTLRQAPQALLARYRTLAFLARSRTRKRRI